MRILLIDGDEASVNSVKEYLADQGIEVFTALTGDEGFEIISKEHLDLVVIDTMMADKEGLETLRHLTADHYDLPVIAYSDRGDEVDRILVLEMGADEFIEKSLSPREVLARLHAVARRIEKSRDIQPSSAGSNGLMLDLVKRHAFLKGERIRLSSIEFDILHIMVQHQGKVMSRERIMELSRGRELYALERSIDIQISRLRRKLEKQPGSPELIKTIWGVGYVFTGATE
ncbi:MAG: response regulator transcription factor [Candidatus Eremiobacteraeota bacterium]|nr:response regulator transcription factor [Candidatus Eremiobacteraeota bacterium]